jgi:cytochrome b561
LTESARPPRWNRVVVALHWIGAALILELLAHGWLMIHGGFSAAETFDLFQWHKSLAFVALAVTLARLLARAATPAPSKPGSPPWERRLSAFVQALLYVATLIAIGSGWLAVSTALLPIPTRFFGLFVVPNIAAPDASLFAAATVAHAVTAFAIVGLVALHIAGALKHALIDRDDVLRRMAPWAVQRPERRLP